ncbi:glycosyltransferase [Microbacterium rhizomatis]|uniref:glycosyltransferase n=1 Tax=Microbacterium rhizomatis TaxID=1631477 RepID=UPI001478C279|nr:glycosyltransferase [Microbacterium rhizomatis]
MTRADVFAVITTFRPDESLLTVIDALRAQTAATIVVDDGSGPSAAPVLATASDRGARVVALEENSGIATALNTGIRAALAQGARFVVTFDQDSEPAAGFIDALMSARDRSTSRGHAVGPVVPEFFAGVRQVHREAEDGTLIARHAIQSGMLMGADLFERVGLMREDLFIDLVDTEFEMRCSAAGLPTVAAPGLRMGHSLGRQYVRTLFGRPFSAPGIPAVVTLSTPFRYYYRVRNRIVVNRRYARTHPVWVARDTVLEVLHFVNALALARPRRALWKLYRAGVADAWRRRMGRMPASIETVAGSISWSGQVSQQAAAR